ncbi:MAG: hypothetical protein ACTSQI_14055 [Candidatus Helarchaeota archaeon]
MALSPSERAQLSATREEILENFNNLLTRRKYLEASLILEDAIGVSKLLGEVDKVAEYYAQIEQCITKLKEISEEIHLVRADPDLKAAFTRERERIVSQAQTAIDNKQYQEACELYRNAVEISLKLDDKKAVWKLSKTILLIEEKIRKISPAVMKPTANISPLPTIKAPSISLPENEPQKSQPGIVQPSIPSSPEIKAPIPPVPTTQPLQAPIHEIEIPTPSIPSIQAPPPPLQNDPLTSTEAFGIDDLVPQSPIEAQSPPEISGIDDLVPEIPTVGEPIVDAFEIDDLIPKPPIVDETGTTNLGIDDLIPTVPEVQPKEVSEQKIIEEAQPETGTEKILFHLTKKPAPTPQPNKKDLPFFKPKVDESEKELFTEPTPELDKKTKKKWELAEKIAQKKLEQAEKEFEKKLKKEEKEAKKRAEKEAKRKEIEAEKERRKKQKGKDKKPTKSPEPSKVGQSALSQDVLAEIKSFNAEKLESVGAPKTQKKVVGGRSLLPPEILAELKKKSEKKE